MAEELIEFVKDATYKGLPRHHVARTHPFEDAKPLVFGKIEVTPGRLKLGGSLWHSEWLLDNLMFIRFIKRPTNMSVTTDSLESTQNKFRQVSALLADRAFLSIEQDMRSTGFLSLLGMTHVERWHSAFWAWLLNPKGSHSLGDFPLRRLLVHMATPSRVDDVSESARKHMAPPAWFETATFVDVHLWPDPFDNVADRELTRDVKIGGKDTKLSFDIALVCRFTTPLQPGTHRLLFICENKVKAKEGRSGNQTSDYAVWALDESHVDDREEVFAFLDSPTDGETPGKTFHSLLFLSPNSEAGSPNFRSLSYQDLVDNVLSPSSEHPARSELGSALLQEYLRNLSSPYGDGEDRIAVSPREANLVDELWGRHEAALESLRSATSVSPLEAPRDTPTRTTVGDLVQNGQLHIGDELLYRRGTIVEKVSVVKGEMGIGIKVGDRVYSAPSSAAKAILGQVCRGWDRFFLLPDETSLLELRSRYLANRPASPSSAQIDEEFIQFSRAILGAHEPAFRLIEQVTQNRDQEKEFQFGFRRPTTTSVDYQLLVASLGARVDAYFRTFENCQAAVDLSGPTPIFYFPDLQRGLSGSRASQIAAERTLSGNPSGSFRWSQEWRIASGLHRGKSFLFALKALEGAETN